MKTTVIILLNLILILSEIHSQSECKIIYISNEGFLIELDGKKVSIDAMFGKIDGNWCDSPSENTLESIRNSTSPFDSVDIIAITHEHIDHFNDSIVVEHLLNNPKGIVVCPKQVGDILSKNPNYVEYSDRIISLTPQMFCDTNIIASNIPIRIMRFEHSHYMMTDSATGSKINKHQNIENLGYLFDINGIKIFHCGDTNPLNEKEYTSFSLNNEEIDIAFLERLFFSTGEKGIEIIKKYIKPKIIILMHINPGNKSLFVNHFKQKNNIKIFENKMESIILNLNE
jgi:L-ascorbate metabolism protein UlaG (beta-lactamase superfamily)